MAVEGEDLAPFVSRLSAEWTASRPEERHRQLEGTLVSADLSGFTAMSERLAAKGKQGAEELTESINGCFAALIAAAAAEPPRMGDIRSRRRVWWARRHGP